MHCRKAIFNTDQVNRAGMVFPAHALMLGEEKHYKKSLRRSTDVGAPSCIQHDMHRPFGWSRPLGLYIDSKMVRSLGMIEVPETEQERVDLQTKISQYWARFHREGTEKYCEDLKARIAPASTQGSRFFRLEATVIMRPGIAANLYPNFFTPGQERVDKDGLVDYRHLLLQMKQVQPGVFHDSDRDVLLFAHRMFRRSHSHRNKLNDYFLKSFHGVAEAHSSLRVRLKLDPDLIGHPASVHNLLELEYWRGPRYSDDIAAIPTGVAEHKADERSRFFEGIDRTHVWWKESEQRTIDERAERFRTFEVEELVEDPSAGLGNNQFGCRYAHAEYSSNQGAITHFDGAIRAYSSEAYLQRIDTSIDRAGKHSDYTKLFRLDGTLAVADWKQLLSDFFRGNKLIPEYLGAPADVDDEGEPEATICSTPTANQNALSALIRLDNGSLHSTLTLCSELHQELEGELIPYVEVGTGAVEEYLRGRMDLSEITTIGIKDGILNLSRFSFGTPVDLKAVFAAEVTALAGSLRQDADNGVITRASIPMVWEVDHLLVTLTIAGDAEKVATVLGQLPDVVDPRQVPSEWIEALSALIKTTTPYIEAPVMWQGVDRGVLSIERSGEAEFQMRLPDALLQKLKDLGKLQIDTTQGQPSLIPKC